MGCPFAVILRQIKAGARWRARSSGVKNVGIHYLLLSCRVVAMEGPSPKTNARSVGTEEGGEADPLLFLVGGGEDGRGEKGRGAPQCLEEEH